MLHLNLSQQHHGFAPSLKLYHLGSCLLDCRQCVRAQTYVLWFYNHYSVSAKKCGPYKLEEHRLRCLKEVGMPRKDSVMFYVFFVCLLVWSCCCRWSHPYMFACVSAFIIIFLFPEDTVLHKHTNQVMPSYTRKSCSRNICNKFIMYFYILFCTQKNNIKWPSQMRVLCLIKEINLISQTILYVSSIISLIVLINWSLWCFLY